MRETPEEFSDLPMETVDDSALADWVEEGPDADICISEVADALTTVSNPVLPPKRSMEKMRIGPLAVPLGVIAWSGSLLLHGGIVAGAVLIAFVGMKLPPLIAFARGDGSAEVGIRNDATGLEQRPFAVPAITPADEVQVAKSLDDLNADEPSEPTFENAGAAPEPTLGDLLSTSEEEMFIGLAPSTGVPAMHGRSKGPPTSAEPAVEPSTPPSSSPSGGLAISSASPAVTNLAGPVGHGGVPSDRGTPGVANGVDSRGIAFPVYPIESLRKREQGTVVLSVELDAKGQLVAINVIKDAGYPRLVKAAIDAIKATTFPPATEGGEPVASITTIPFRFSLR